MNDNIFRTSQSPSRYSAFFVAASVTLVVALGKIAGAEEAVVWGIQPASNKIVQVDPETGQVMSGFTPPGGALTVDQLFGGLTIAEQGETLLYQNPVTNPTDLFRIDPSNGSVKSVEFMPAVADNPEFRAGLSFQSGAGINGADAIYAINDGMPAQRQDGYGNPLLVDHTPSMASFAGALGGDDQGRQFIAITEVMDMALSFSIVEFDPVSANTVLNTFPLTAADTAGGLAFDGSHLYYSDQSGQLITLDPNDGTVLNSVLVAGGPLIGLAALRVPEPGSLLLLGILGLMMACQRKGHG